MPSRCCCSSRCSSTWPTSPLRFTNVSPTYASWRDSQYEKEVDELSTMLRRYKEEQRLVGGSVALLQEVLAKMADARRCQRELERLNQIERDKEQEKEFEKQREKELELELKLEREKERGKEMKRQRDFEKEIDREREIDRENVADLEMKREKERDRLRDIQFKKNLELKLKQVRETDKMHENEVEKNYQLRIVEHQVDDKIHKHKYKQTQEELNQQLQYKIQNTQHSRQEYYQQKIIYKTQLQQQVKQQNQQHIEDTNRVKTIEKVDQIPVQDRSLGYRKEGNTQDNNGANLLVAPSHYRPPLPLQTQAIKAAGDAIIGVRDTNYIKDTRGAMHTRGANDIRGANNVIDTNLFIGDMHNKYERDRNPARGGTSLLQERPDGGMRGDHLVGQDLLKPLRSAPASLSHTAR